jgi:hypothetical protein
LRLSGIHAFTPRTRTVHVPNMQMKPVRVHVPVHVHDQEKGQGTWTWTRKSIALKCNATIKATGSVLKN